ncbi:MAG: ABC transporter ATP-binding protein [Deltaproteobacteria bacterium]|nr:ABC transporter ATP-binding protein [Deltaproteobacteria bacterium]
MFLKCNNITKLFGGLAALQDVSFEVEDGEIRGLIGPNGSGKTTLFNVISGVLKPTEGKVMFMERDITPLSPYNICHLGIARSFQIPHPFKEMTVWENVALGALFGKDQSFSDEEAKEKAKEIIDFVGLQVKDDTYPGELTAGGLRKLELARALATKPKLLLADEVLSGLSKKEMQEASMILKRIRDEMGITIIWVEHIMDVLMDVVDKVTVLNYGALIAEGTPEEVANNEEVVEAYLGKE